MLGPLAGKYGCSSADIELESVREWKEQVADKVVEYAEVTFRIKGRQHSQRLSAEASVAVAKAKSDHASEFSAACLEGREVDWNLIGLPKVSAMGPHTFLSTTGGLKAHEGVLLRSGQPSHGLDQHCERSWEALERDIQSGSKLYATSFSFREIMEIVVAGTLDTERKNILTWVQRGAELRTTVAQRGFAASVGLGCVRHGVRRTVVRVAEIGSLAESVGEFR